MQELSLHILDLIQNGLEAGANEISLDICEDTDQDILSIRVTDNGRGMDAAMAASVRSPFVTSRTTRKVGLGLPLIDMTTQQCGGSLSIESCPGIGTKVEANYCFSHIDRPPLGNMANTLKILFAVNPNVHITYRHRVDHAEFSMDSWEIGEALGDVPLTHPDVLDWLAGYIGEGLRKLYGGNQK